MNGRPDIAHRDLNSGVPAPAADPHVRPAERGSFEMLCRDTGVSFDECIEKAQTGWYVKANEALKLRLVEGGL
ncbi:hypothetical protein [Allomesorhizobium camelthorni]|uniref:Uncharacterized protein n=1 Tax=Allomesorhizobium camelthorni TaxID=475069 RepID=A0A6G4WDU6_9HYPH|nr:hypothetical protein [Mesorhizobium camelthorni]NGO52310.1 hypothetical protein [Mesorhizobium camelthorni]